MITAKINGDVLASKYKHVVFATNEEGYNDAGFAGAVSRRYWPELGKCGPQLPGSTKVKEAGAASDKTFHAIVCHSLKPNGWADAPTHVKAALDRLAKSTGDGDVACVLMGGGPVGLMMGADVKAIMAAIDASEAKVALFSMGAFPE